MANKRIQEEKHDCEKVHPDESHKQWKKGSKVSKESIDLLQFVKSVTEKNYAAANKYLQASIEAKMVDRMKEVPKNTGF
jgi:hypothetical protein